MSVLTSPKTRSTATSVSEQFRIKAGLLDEILELIEDRYLGQLMRQAEKEKNVPLCRAASKLR
ncbi:MAG: hypothetical protein HY978_03720 [Candidatus Liptonbacteria bacterium]|nr:hypothetical protein [Candidatus Liptonbacteria bacterium]